MSKGGAPFGDLFTLMVWKSMRTGGAPFGDLFKGILYHIGFYTCVFVYDLSNMMIIMMMS